MLQQQTQITRAEFQSAGNSTVHTLISHELQRYSLFNMITKINKHAPRNQNTYTHQPSNAFIFMPL